MKYVGESTHKLYLRDYKKIKIKDPNLKIENMYENTR